MATGGSGTGGGAVTGGGLATGGGSVTGGGLATGGGAATGGGVATGGGFVTGGGTTSSDGGTLLSTITAVQQGTITPGSCVQVSAVAMSAVFSDPDDAIIMDGGTRTPRSAFYISEKNLTTTAPNSGIEVVSTLTAAPSVAVGDDLVVTGEYFENFNNSTLRLTPACCAVTRVGATTVPQPAVVTLSEIGQSGGSSGCPVSGAAWVDGTNAESYEGVLVRIQSGTVSAGRDSFGLFELSSGADKVQVSTSFGLTANPALGGSVTSLTGFGHFSFCRRKLRPRSDSEVTITSSSACGSGTRANHLVISEVVVTPTPAESIEVWNPTSTAISLSNVWLYNATFVADGGTSCFYQLAPTGGACGTTFNDFNLRFPAGASIAPGEFQTIALTGAANYCGFFSCLSSRPTYEVAATGFADDPLVANMLGDFDSRAVVFVSPDGGSGQGLLSNGGEDAVLYSWDGVASTVQDVDYVIWGTTPTYRTDKTGVPGYLADTPSSSQRPMTGTPSATLSYQRVCTNEGAERKTGGNGLTGHDETSEDLDLTWVLQAPTPKAQTNGASP